MALRALDEGEFQELVQPLIGLDISHPRRNVGSSVFLELGALTQTFHPRTGRRLNDRGEACIVPFHHWRIETATEVLHGTSGNLPRVLRALEFLRGKKIEAIGFTGGLPELVVKLSGGLFLRTLDMFAGDPAWAIKLPDGHWLAVDAGQLVLEEGYPWTPSEEDWAEREEEIVAGKTLAKRWGIPRIEPSPGDCSRCHFFARLNADFALFNYGCCCCVDGPFQGRVIHSRSGCPGFQLRSDAED